MDLKESLRAIRRNAGIIAVILTGSLAAGAAYAALAPPTYLAQTRLLVSPAGDLASAAELVQVNALILEQVDTYTELVSTPLVLQPVIDELGLEATPEELEQDVSTSASPNSAIISIEAVSGSATQAADIAGAVGRSLGAVLSSAEGTGEAGPRVGVTVIAQPVVPDEPASPSLVLSLGVALAAGLAIAFLVVVLRETLNPFVRNGRDVALAVDARYLGRVPRVKGRRARTVPGAVMVGDGSGVFGLVRDKVLSGVGGTAAPVIVVTSPGRAEGKSVVAANLALAFAAAGRRVTLVDADLRAPALGAAFEVDGAGGVADVLTGAVDPGKVAVHRVAPGVTLVPTSPADSSVTPDAFASPRARDLVQSLATSAEIVVIDAGAIVEPPDAAALSGVASSYLLVARAGRTRISALQRAVRTVAAVGGSAVGVVLADAPTTGADRED